MGGAGTITVTTIPHAAITAIATTGMIADIGTTAIGMTGDTAITEEIDHAVEGTGTDRKKDRTPSPHVPSSPPGERGIGVSGDMGTFEGLGL